MRIPIYVFPFLADVFLGSFMTACIIHSQKSGASYVFIGPVLSMLPSACYSIGAYGVGRFVRNEHVRGLLLSSVVGGGLLSVVALVVGNYRLLAVILPLTSLMMGLYFVPFQMLMMQRETTTNPVRTAALYNVAWSGGYGVGSLAVGYLLDISRAVGFSLPVVTVVLNVALMWCMWDELKVSAGNGGMGDRSGAAELTTAVRPVDLIEYYLPIAWLSLLACCFVMGYVRSVYVKTADEVLGLSPSQIGWLFGGQSLAMAVGSGVWYFCHGVAFRKLPVVVSVVTLGVAMSLLGMVRSYCDLLVGFVLVGAVGSFVFLGSVTYAGSHPTRRGRVLGVNELLVGVGMLSAPLITGLAAEYDYRLAIAIATAIVGLLIAGVAALLLRPH